ncbi:MAG: glycosyltransferase N-terminal domain-containing protein, partial [Bacteroidota bacterium]
MQWLYHIGIYLLGFAMRLAAIFHPKARKWVQGRKDWASRLSEQIGEESGPLIWMHCASLGEFEQGRNLLEAIKEQYPQHRIALSFYSPSGYEIRKEYAK